MLWFENLEPAHSSGGMGSRVGQTIASGAAERQLQQVVLLPRAMALQLGVLFQLEDHASLVSQIPRGIHDRTGLETWTAFDQTKLVAACRLMRQASIALRCLAALYRTQAEAEMSKDSAGGDKQQQHQQQLQQRQRQQGSNGQCGDLIGLIVVEQQSGTGSSSGAVSRRARACPEFYCVEEATLHSENNNVAAAFQRCLDRGATRIVCHPVHLEAPAFGMLDDILETASRRFPGIDYGVSMQSGLSGDVSGISARETHGAHCLTSGPNFAALLFAFAASANLALDLRAQGHALGSGGSGGSRSALLNADAPDVAGLCATLCDTVNNLVAVLHDCTFLMAAEAADEWRADVDAATKVTAQFESASFLGTVTARLRELMGLRPLSQDQDQDQGQGQGQGQGQ
jgi:hypothetical protein